jgi:dTDP-4-dehydrorhamnose 3,5-epimerase
VVEFAKALSSSTTTIPGLTLFQLPVHGDNRGWFKENWQREKMTAAGLPDFGPVQNNVSFNDEVGTTRGIHAEPWDKFVSVATGRIFGAWVDLREGPTFGAVFTAELDPSVAIFVPRGVGNSYQTLEPNTAYVYLVNDHWSADAQSQYTFLNLADETAAIEWPIPLADAELSDKDRAHPRLDAVMPMPGRKTLILGAGGQLGLALQAALPDAMAATRETLDITDPAAVASFPWKQYDTVINAAAYTNVDGAETDEGRADAWRVNVAATAALARVATENRLTLVHVSSDYVFDGSREEHDELEPFSPLGVYGQTKAAADAIVATVPQHFVVRTSWVVGEGKNFVRTMASLADRGIDPSVVDDQVGRLSFTDDIAAAIVHLLSSQQSGASYGTYNVSNSGDAVSWAEIAQAVFLAGGHDSARVSGVSTAEYFAGKVAAPRPLHSALALEKLLSTGFEPRDWRVALSSYLATDAS